MPSVTGMAHLGLTVRNLALSETWYCNLFGLARVYSERQPHFDSVVLQDPVSMMVISLRQHFGAGTARFDETRTGLDHISFGVADRQLLDEWEAHLSDMAVEHSPIAETDFGSVLVYHDPDHIQMELFCRRDPPHGEFSTATAAIAASENGDRRSVGQGTGAAAAVSRAPGPGATSANAGAVRLSPAPTDSIPGTATSAVTILPRSQPSDRRRGL